MWDGYQNVGTNKPHDATSTVWCDTTGTYGFTLNNLYVGDNCCKFAVSTAAYGELSAADTAAAFDLAVNGTLEVVFDHNVAAADGVVLQRSTFGLLNWVKPDTDTICLGNISALAGKGSVLEWDGHHVTNNSKADEYVTRSYRNGWNPFV